MTAEKRIISKLKLPKIESEAPFKSTRVNNVDDNGSDEFHLPKLPIISSKKNKEHNEGIKEYICKKRELFMIQFNLNLKEKEVNELSSFIIKEELDLQQAENNLELETKVFEEFIEESKKLAIEANEKAEKTRKSKLEKNQEIKQLQSQIIHLKHEISKFEDSLRELETYEQFVARLTLKPEVEESKEPNSISETKETYLLDPKELLCIYQSLRERIINQMSHLVHEEQIKNHLKEYTAWLNATVGNAIADLESERQNLVTTLDRLNDKVEETIKLLTCLRETMSSEQFLSETKKKEELNKKINYVYESCVRHNEAKLEPLHLLAEIEKLFVELLMTIETMQQDKVQELQKLRTQQRDEISRRSRLLTSKTKGGCQKCEDRHKRKQTRV